MLETSCPSPWRIQRNTEWHAENHDCTFINERQICQEVHQHVCRYIWPQEIHLWGIQKESLGNLPTGQHPLKGQTRTCHTKAKIIRIDQRIYPSVPTMPHWGTIQYWSQWQVPNSTSPKCHKTRTYQICGNLPDPLNQLQWVQQLGPCPNTSRMHQSQAESSEEHFDCLFQCFCKVLELKSKIRLLCQSKLQWQKSHCQLLSKQVIFFHQDCCTSSTPFQPTQHLWWPRCPNEYLQSPCQGQMCHMFKTLAMQRPYVEACYKTNNLLKPPDQLYDSSWINHRDKLYRKGFSCWSTELRSTVSSNMVSSCNSSNNKLTMLCYSFSFSPFFSLWTYYFFFYVWI